MAVELAQKQPSCDACFDDVATMRRDAKRSEEKSINILKDLETDHKKGKAAGLAQAWAAWKAIVGDKVPGISGIGKFDWMRCEEKFFVEIGKTEKETTVPMTHFQYKEYLKGLGMTPVAAEARLNRKLLDPETIHDKCPESELPTIRVSKGK